MKAGRKREKREREGCVKEKGEKSNRMSKQLLASKLIAVCCGTALMIVHGTSEKKKIYQRKAYTLKHVEIQYFSVFFIGNLYKLYIVFVKLHVKIL